jgi:hypothetical protein
LTGFSLPVQAIQSAYAAFADGDGDIYTIAKNGSLRWYQHTGRMSGADTWANFATAKVVGDKATGNNLLNNKIFSGDDGVIYTIAKSGKLYWSRHDGRFTGSQSWANGGRLTQIGSGWNNFVHAFSGGDGIIYAISADGKMYWFRHSGWLTGSSNWAPNSGVQISKGWQGAVKVFSGGDGIIYSIMSSGLLRWHRHNGRLSGSDDWANGGAHLPVGYNWQNFRQVFTGGDGIIYAIKANGQVLWNRHIGWLTGVDAWAPEPVTNDAGRVITKGWLLP